VSNNCKPLEESKPDMVLCERCFRPALHFYFLETIDVHMARCNEHNEILPERLNSHAKVYDECIYRWKSHGIMICENFIYYDSGHEKCTREAKY
jgi:hypothetical protein